MTVYVKSGGAWRAAANGRLWIKSGGAWRIANYCYIKSGGVWRDSGYRGFPAAPTGLYVTSWDFGTVNLQFSAGSGGAPVDHWVVEKLNSGGGVVTSVNSSGSASFGVSQDEQCQFRAYAVTPAGITSRPQDGGPGYSNVVRTLIGHTETGYYQNENRTRPWQSGISFGGMHRYELAPVYVPASVNMYNWHVYCYLNFGGPYISGDPAGGNNRQVDSYYAGTDIGPNYGYPWNLSSFEVDIAIAGGGQNAYWGFYTNGLGWSPAGVSDAQLLYGQLMIYGTETYQVSVYYQTRAYLANNYW